MEFQIEIDQESHFDQVAKDIPDIVSYQLQNIMDSCLKELKLDDQVFIIDKMVLDLGVLDLSNFKNILADRFKIQFLNEIKKQLLTNHSSKLSQEELSFAIFNFFVMQGARPWWLVSQVRNFGGFAQQAFSLKPRKFTQNIRFLMRRPLYKRRILENISEDLLIDVLTVDKRLDRPIYKDSIYSVKGLFKRKYRHWNESKISSAFKEIILHLFLDPNRIDQPWKLELAIFNAIQQNHPELVMDESIRKWQKNKQGENQKSTKDLENTSGNKREIVQTVDFEFLQSFQFYLQNGYRKPGNSSLPYKFNDVNNLFQFLISNHLDQVVELLLALGKKNAIKKRFLETISQELISRFFGLVAPSKQKLLEWVIDVFEQVQEEYRPINQTFINVKKSINEITFELFLNQKLTSINDENYLRLLFKQTARKFGVGYKTLLFFTIKSLSFGVKKYLNFKFQEILLSIYAKDFLKSKRNSSRERVLFAADVPEDKWELENYQNLDFVTNLFLDFAKQSQVKLSAQAKEWLKTKLETISLLKTADLIQVWEEFASKFSIAPHQLILFVLIQKNKNPTIHLSSESFKLLKKKYQFSGIFADKKPNVSELILTFQTHKKWISSQTLKDMLMRIDVKNQVEKLDFRVIVDLICPGIFPVVENYLRWLDELLLVNQLQSKKKKVYNWFFHLLLEVSKKNVSLEYFQLKTREFLELVEPISIGLPTSNPKTRAHSANPKEMNGAESFHQTSVYDHHSSKSAHAFFRIVEILGKQSVLQIFPDSKKFGDKILYQLLTTKYQSEFFSLLKKHQFNKELRDYVLSQAPLWLKKDLLQFINKSSIDPWHITIGRVKDYFEKTNWLKTKDQYLVDFIEKTFWAEIFESSVFSFEELVHLVIQRALLKNQMSNKFWEDYSDFKSSQNSSEIVQNISFPIAQLRQLSGFGFLDYVEVLGKKKSKINESFQLLERILYDFDFPAAHSFEGYEVGDFKSYIQKLVKTNKKMLVSLLTRVESPFLLQRFLGLLDENTLKFLIDETFKNKGFIAGFKRLETIILFFRIKDKSKIIRLYKRWMESVIFDLPHQTNPAQLAAQFLKMLIEEDLVSHEKMIAEVDWKMFIERLEFDEKSSILFFEKLAQFDSKLFLGEKFLNIKNDSPSFLEGKDPLQLVFYPNRLSFKDYTNLVEHLFEIKLLNPVHRQYLMDWVSFAAHYQSKKYLQLVLKLYFLRKLDSVSTVFGLKAQLVPAFVSNLNFDLPELRLFLSRLSYMPTLIAGVPWVSPQNLGKVELENWRETWESINRRLAEKDEKEAWEELVFQLFLSESKEYWTNKETFNSFNSLISSKLNSIPFDELFTYKIHPDRFLDLIEIKSSSVIYAYFVSGKDPHFKTLKGKKFLLTWIQEFFDQTNEEIQSQFMALFYKVFYQSALSQNQSLVFFLKGFFAFEAAQKAFRVVTEKMPSQIREFYEAHPAFFGTVISKDSVLNLSTLEVCRLFLETGILPKGLSGLEELGRELVKLKSQELKQFRILIHASLQSERGKLHFQKLAAYMDESWFLELIHPQLSKDLGELSTFLRSKGRTNFFEDLRINQKLDRLVAIALRWARRPVSVKSSLEILVGLLEKWVDLVDPELLVGIFETNKKLPELLVLLKNSSSRLKKILEEEATEDEKEEKKIIPVELEPVDYGEGVSIANAGLVLFWPFYGRFFNALGMIGREGMKGEDIRERAIQLLQYIATGKTEFEEWDLTLNKILCGAAPDFPVGTKIELTDEEEELCEKLILGTIYNWEKLRGTRLETFRETFVRRDGMLYRKENRWELVVENKAYDVLMDTLTWNITMINLSWMNTRINVTWR